MLEKVINKGLQGGGVRFYQVKGVASWVGAKDEVGKDVELAEPKAAVLVAPHLFRSRDAGKRSIKGSLKCAS